MEEVRQTNNTFYEDAEGGRFGLKRLGLLYCAPSKRHCIEWRDIHGATKTKTNTLTIQTKDKTISFPMKTQEGLETICKDISSRIAKTEQKIAADQYVTVPCHSAASFPIGVTSSSAALRPQLFEKATEYVMIPIQSALASITSSPTTPSSASSAEDKRDCTPNLDPESNSEGAEYRYVMIPIQSAPASITSSPATPFSESSEEEKRKRDCTPNLDFESNSEGTLDAGAYTPRILSH